MYARSIIASAVCIIAVLIIGQAWSPFYPTARTSAFSFQKAKEIARNEIYRDHQTTFYCGCDFVHSTSASGGVLISDSCGYKPKRRTHRAKRIEWEHIVPAYEIGKNRSCYDGDPICVKKDGTHFKGRRCCLKVDQAFRRAHADLHNLTPAIGELNQDRAHFRFNEIVGEERVYGRCDFEVNQNLKIAEPALHLRGAVARIWLYMIQAYDIKVEPEYITMLHGWNETNPPNAWEFKRDQRIKRAQGNSNPYLYP